MLLKIYFRYYCNFYFLVYVYSIKSLVLFFFETSTGSLRPLYIQLKPLSLNKNSTRTYTAILFFLCYLFVYSFRFLLYPFDDTFCFCIAYQMNLNNINGQANHKAVDCELSTLSDPILPK